MINTRQLTRPSPSDGNLLPSNDGLAMIQNGGNDFSRFFYYKGLKQQVINNRTSNPFYYILNSGGTNTDGRTLSGIITANNGGGIIPIAPKPLNQSTKNPVSNNPYPVINALIDAPINPQVNKFVNKPLPPFVNPIAVR